MLAHVYVFLIIQLPILSIRFINAWIYNHCIRYQVLHTLFLSIFMAVSTIHLLNLTMNIEVHSSPECLVPNVHCT